MKIPKLYALYSETRECFMGLNVNASEFEGSPIVEYSLSKYFEGDDILWTTTRRADAEWIVANSDTMWYNTSPTQPGLRWRRAFYGELTIVELN